MITDPKVRDAFFGLTVRRPLIDFLVQELDNLTRQKLNELVLKGNPISNEASYKNDVQMRFPSLKMLDGMELQPLISFNLPDVGSSIPPILGSYFDSNVRTTLTLFQTSIQFSL